MVLVRLLEDRGKWRVKGERKRIPVEEIILKGHPYALTNEEYNTRLRKLADANGANAFIAGSENKGMSPVQCYKIPDEYIPKREVEIDRELRALNL